jgi:hypothetical protein
MPRPHGLHSSIQDKVSTWEREYDMLKAEALEMQ